MQHGSKPQYEHREPMQAIAELALTRVDAASFDETLQLRQTVSVGMSIGPGRTGALNIYSADDSVLRAGRLEDAHVFAAYAAVVINNLSSYAHAASEAMNLRIAMESRSVIEQAKGIVMASTHCTAEEAFVVLRHISQEENVKLRELAQSLVDSLKSE